MKVKLCPTSEQACQLSEDLSCVNSWANRVSAYALEHDEYSVKNLRTAMYQHIRGAGVASQAAQHVIKKVVDAYTTKQSNLKAGRYGRIGSPRRAKIESRPVVFRDQSSHPYDQRNSSWNHENKQLALTTMSGRRIKDIAFIGRLRDLDLLTSHKLGELDLIHTRDDQWFVSVCVHIDEPPVVETDKFIGVDMGVVVIAAVARDDGTRVADWSGGAVTARRKKNVQLRQKLQKKGTKSAKRLLKKRSRKEARFVNDVNHCISKSIVAEAKRTGHGIAVEKLTGIRERVRLRKPRRVAVHSWSFADLGQKIEYKAKMNGVIFTQVDPRYTSQTCSRCGNIAKKSRINQATYKCISCGISLNADINAAVNIARRGVNSMGAVNRPNVS